MRVLKLCGVLAVFALAVLAKPIDRNLNEGLISKTGDKLADYHMMNDDPAAGEEAETTIDPASDPAAGEDKLSAVVGVMESSLFGTAETTELNTATPDVVDVTASPTATSTSKPKRTTPRIKQDEPPTGDPGAETTTPKTKTTTAEPAATTPANGSSFSSPNRMSIAALVLMLIVKTFGTY